MMSSTLCLILSAILLLIGLLVFAALLLWCETFQVTKKGGAQPPATADADQEKSTEGDAEAKAKADEEAAQAKAQADAEAKAKADEQAAQAKAQADAEAKAKADEQAAQAKAQADAEAKAKADEQAAQAKADEEKADAAAALAAKEADAQQASDSADSSEPDADGDGLPDIETATAEQAAAAFSEELDAGFARQEEQLGIIYNERPVTVDDLKLIKGVGNILEQKLHNSGIHRFKQIALWTDTAAREFGAKLSFRDRIFRDDWIAQAKKFHQEKYGEKL